MLGVFAEFETNIRRERQMEGCAKAKAEGQYLGRKPIAREKSERVLELVGQGLTKKAVACELEIGVASVYQILKST